MLTTDMATIMSSRDVYCYECSNPLSLDDRLARVDNEINQTTELGAENKTLLDKAKEDQTKLNINLHNGWGPRMKALDSLFSELGADRATYFQEFNGNQVKRLLHPDNAEKLWALLPEHPTRDYHAQYMKCLAKVYQYTTIDTLSQDEIDEFPKLMNELVTSLRLANPSQSVTPKLHMLTAHVHDFMIRHKFWGKLSEQGIESMHAHCHFLERKYQAVKGDNYLLSIVNDICFSNLLHDCAAYKEPEE